jgi:hypothetical protein
MLPFRIATTPAGMMYHKSSGIIYAATKSISSSTCTSLFPAGMWHGYAPPFGLLIVDFTCTRYAIPSCSTIKSYGADSPHSFATRNRCSIARDKNRTSAHSPRSLAFLNCIPRCPIARLLS